MGERKKSVIIVGASELVFPAFRIAREDLGLNIIAFDYNPDAVGMRYADVPMNVDTKDVEGAVAKAKELSASYDIQGVFTCGADVEVTVAAMAETLALPGIPLSVARDCNDKIRMHQRLDAQNFQHKARYRIITEVSQLGDAASYVGFPCVIKPIANCASRGVQRLEHGDELHAAYVLAQSFNMGEENRVLLEQSLEGSKHTVEMIAYEGETHLLSIIDTHYISPRWPCETGLNTSLLSQDKQQQAFDFAKDVARAIGIDYGAHKVDINIDASGQFSVIELTARLSGGFHCQYASPLAYGSNDIRAALKLAVGMPLDMEDIRHKWSKGSAVRAVFPEAGVIRQIEGVAEAKAMPGVAEVFIWCKPGDKVGPYHNSADRVAYVIAEGEDTMTAIANAELATKQIQITTEQ